MTHQSGISACDALLETFAKAKSQSLRLVKVEIETEELVATKVLPAAGSWEEDYDSFILPLLDNHTPCYVLYRLDSQTNVGYEWLLLNWIPDEAQVRHKMLYASTRATLRRQFGDSFLSGDILGHHKNDLDLEGYRKHLSAMNAPPPLTYNELERNAVAKTELAHTGLLESHQTMGGVNFPLTAEAISSTNRFVNGDLNYVQLAIDIPNERINLVDTKSTVSISELPTITSKDRGSYHLLRFPHVHEGKSIATIYFIHLIAGYGSPIKERMLSSSCKSSLTATLAEKYHITIDHRLELDSIDEVTEEHLLDVAHPKAVQTSLRITKPKGPSSRGPRRLIQ